MGVPAMIRICGTQRMPGEQPERIELVTQGTYSYEPGCVTLSYVETQMTGLEGAQTSFTVEEEKRVILRRTGPLDSVMAFEKGLHHESLYHTEGVGTLLLGTKTRDLRVLLNEKGGILDLEYGIEIENTFCGINEYHIEVRVL